MPWLEKRLREDGTKRYRIRDRINGQKVTIVDDAGMWKDIAEARLTDLRKSIGAGPENAVLAARRLKVDEACDIFFSKHSPGLKPSSQRNVSVRLGVIKRAWSGKWFDDLTKYDVRDLLARFRSIGNSLKYLRVLTTLFHRFEEWNEDAKVLGFIVKTPHGNPAKKWRKEMRPSQKKERPRERILSPEEWERFRQHLTKRALAICELSLRRFLRTTDIKRISHLNIVGAEIRGLQAKTGEAFIIPTLEKQPKKYDFTNFRKEFEQAKIAAGMDFPSGHPLHFTSRDLRRTGATWAYRKTKDLKGISTMLGHTNTKTTELYLHIDEADRRAIAAAVDEIARGAPVGQNPVHERK